MSAVSKARDANDVETVDRVRAALSRRDVSVTTVVPSYCEGAGIVVTLDSLWDGMAAIGLERAAIFLSDSSPEPVTVDAARAWAMAAGCRLIVDHSNDRRSLKQALNVALAAVRTDLVVVTNADVVLPRASLAHLLAPFLVADPVDVVVGVAAPDPSVTGLSRRAGAFQLRAVQRLVEMSGPVMRAEGAFWSAHRRFYRSFRFPIGQGSVADDVELVKAVQERGCRGVTVPAAVVFKVPPGTVRDFCLQTRHFYYATAGSRRAGRSRPELRAFVDEARRDPLGAVLYSIYRGISAGTAWHWAQAAHAELWEQSTSTRREPVR